MAVLTLKGNSMNRLIRSAAFALMLLPVPGSAQDFDAGYAAYEAGDYATALREFKPLAEQGNALAQYNLGLMYSGGEGVPHDVAESGRLFRLAAEQGNALAQFACGSRYAFGRGVPQDYLSAHMWYNISAANGSKGAATQRDNVAAKMSPADITEAQRRANACVTSNYRDCDPARGWWFW